MANDSRVSTWRMFRAAVGWMFLVATLLPMASMRQSAPTPDLHKGSDAARHGSGTSAVEDIAVILWDEPDKPDGKGQHAPGCAESAGTEAAVGGECTALLESR